VSRNDRKEANMKLKHALIVLVLAALGAAGMASAQTPDNPDRKETTRERENPERAVEPPERVNPERIDPLLEAELQKCEGLEEEEYGRCMVAAKRKFGEM
jgi:hypothetical protein